MDDALIRSKPKPRYSCGWMDNTEKISPVFAYGAILCATILAVWRQYALGITTDVSWLLTVNERILDGETLYHDLWELNPPFSVWLYRLPVLASHLTGISAEVSLHIFALLLGFASLMFATGILSKAELLSQNGRLWFVCAWIVLLILFPAFNYLQREYFGLLALIPWLTLQAARQQPNGQFTPGAWSILIAGIGCATMVIVKPHYLPTVLLSVAYMCWRSKSLRPVFHPENLIGAALFWVYLGLAYWMHPLFFGEFLDRLLVAYTPSRQWFNLALYSICFAAIIGLVALSKDPRKWSALTWLLLSAATGQIIGTWIMGRAFPYHVYPAFVLALAALAVNAKLNVRFAVLAPCAALVGVFLHLIYSSTNPPPSALKAYLTENHKNARVIAISTSMADGHPLVRNAGLKWIATGPALLITAYGNVSLQSAHPQSHEAIHTAMRQEQLAYRQRIQDTLPNLVVIPNRLSNEYPGVLETIWQNQDDSNGPESLYSQTIEIDGYRIFELRQ